MGLETLIGRIDGKVAQAFVTAARHLIDALLRERAAAEAVRTPAARDYASATLSRTTPAGGWISQQEIAQTASRLAEAIAAEKWTDGALLALRLLWGIGAIG
jgi:hypothetical protein